MMVGLFLHGSSMLDFTSVSKSMLPHRGSNLRLHRIMGIFVDYLRLDVPSLQVVHVFRYG